MYAVRSRGGLTLLTSSSFSHSPVGVSQLNTEEDLPNTLRNKLSQYDDEELNRGVVVAQDQADAREIKQVVRRRRDTIHRQTVWEIVTETTEITEMVTETRTTSAAAEEAGSAGHVQEGSDSSVAPSTPEPEERGALVVRSKRKVPKRIKNPFQWVTAWARCCPCAVADHTPTRSRTECSPRRRPASPSSAASAPLIAMSQ